ncbi:hypothetical protein GFY24_32340 [Nocardia sp. SYP-A9097]|uniref:DUF6510 family protein n=1 Tax=Nocardia sp. SYP-A9097 TaxID=2663237 RepID=UPI00129A9321|nr:DUF6510 family protein [Nocardia sp. SYP-A9097]MRH92075.1 hypothetical protein [Nocardia sp. SYP-A9097]
MTTHYTYATGTDDEAFLDGNALAGTLAEIFTADLTACGCRCGACGVVEPLARALVYLHCPGAIARCPHCTAVVLRITTTPSGRWLDLGEGAALCLPIPEG